MKNNRAMEVSKACEPAVNAVLLAKAYAEIKRDQVDAVSSRILAEGVYMVAPDRQDHGRENERITEPRFDWLMSAESFVGYHAKRNKILLETGIKPADMPDDHCPALVAEHLLVKAEWALLETAWALVAPDQPADGWENLYGEMREKFIDLVIKMVINRPGYKNPLTGAAA